MNEQQNVALIQKVLQAFGRGDVPVILANVTDDCEFYCPGPAIVPYTGTKKGPAQIQNFFDTLLGTQTGASLAIDQFVAQDETVVVIGRYTSQVKATGKPIDTPVVLTFHLRNGKIKRNMVMGDSAALAASYTASAAAGS